MTNCFVPFSFYQEAEETSKQQKPGADAKGGKKGVAGSGRTSKMAGSGRTSKMAGGKKGKETPAMEATPAVSVPQKPATSMKKRGEEDLDSKYIGKDRSHNYILWGAHYTLQRWFIPCFVLVEHVMLIYFVMLYLYQYLMLQPQMTHTHSKCVTILES